MLRTLFLFNNNFCQGPACDPQHAIAVEQSCAEQRPTRQRSPIRAYRAALCGRRRAQRNKSAERRCKTLEALEFGEACSSCLAQSMFEHMLQQQRFVSY